MTRNISCEAQVAPLRGANNYHMLSGGLRFAPTTGYFRSNPSG